MTVGIWVGATVLLAAAAPTPAAPPTAVLEPAAPASVVAPGPSTTATPAAAFAAPAVPAATLAPASRATEVDEAERVAAVRLTTVGPRPASTPSQAPALAPAPSEVTASEVPTPEARGRSGDDERAPGQRPPPTGAVTIAFGGDVHFESWIRGAVTADPKRALRPLRKLTRGADLTVVNLETAITKRGTPASKQFVFRGPAQGLTALAAAGVDVVSIANNHGMDYGADGLIDTLAAARDQGLAIVGGGRNRAQAYRAYRTEINGHRIAVFGATQVLDAFALDAWQPGPGRAGIASAETERDGLRHLRRAIRRTATSVDTVVVVLHWGQEGSHCPLPRQRRLAAQLRAAGADVIVGGHAHRVGPGGHLGDAAVHYGLGNLIFYTTGGPGADSGAFIVRIAPDGTMKTKWRPARLVNGIATPLSGPARRAAVHDWNALRSCSDLRDRPTKR